MLKRPLTRGIAALAILLTSSAAGETPYSTSAPPLRFQGDSLAMVYFTSDVEAVCGPSDPGTKIIACTQPLKKGGHLVTLPNPCLWADSEFFARIACHEAGHVLGWPGNHPD